MDVKNPTTRPIIATLDVREPSSTVDGDPVRASEVEFRTYEIPAGESITVDDYVVATTLIEYGAVADPDEIQAARALHAEQNRTANSRVASASASDGKILGRQQATVDVATGTADTSGPLAGAALAAAVKEANESGAEIPTRGTVAEKREALAAWQASRGASSDLDGEYLVGDDGELVLDDDGQPYPLASVARDDDGEVVYGDDGKPTLRSEQDDNPQAGDGE